MDVILHLCPQRSLTCQDCYLLCHCKTLSLHNSAKLQVLTLGAQVEELMASPLMHHKIQEAEVTLQCWLIIYSGRALSKQMKTTSMIYGCQWQKLAFQVTFIIVLLVPTNQQLCNYYVNKFLSHFAGSRTHLNFPAALPLRPLLLSTH